MNPKVKQKYFLVAMNLAVTLLVVGIFFLKPGYLFFTDYTVGPHLKLDPTSSWFFVDLIFSFFSRVVSAAFIQKVFLAVLTYCLLCSGNALAKCFSEKMIVIFLAGLFVLFNPFVYERIMYGQVGVALGLAFFIFGIAYFINFFKNKNYRDLIWSGFFIGFAILFSNHYLFFLVLIGILSIICFFPVWKEEIKNKHFWKSILIAFGICVLINGTWLGATLIVKGNMKETLLSSITTQDLTLFQMSGKTPTQSLELGVMMSGFWGKDQYRFIDLTQVKGLWGRAFIVTFPIIILGVFVLVRDRRTRRSALFLILLFGISLFLALGIKSAFSGAATLWLFHNVPFYVGMRETEKWIGCVVIAYAAFLVTGLDWLYARYPSDMSKYIISWIVACAIVLQAPYLLFGFAGQVRPVQYPADWSAIDRVIVNDTSKCNGTTLFLPWHMYMSFTWMTGTVVQNPAKDFFSCPVLTGTDIEWEGVYDNSGNPTSAVIEEWIAGRGSSQKALLAQIPSLKYIIIAKEIDWKNYAWIDALPDVHLVFDGSTLRLYQIDR